MVTYEIEKIGAAALAAVQQHAPLRPGAHVLAVVQDRVVQKDWLQAQGLPVGPYVAVASAAEVQSGWERWHAPCRLKTRYGGYDGRGQAPLKVAADAADAWAHVGQMPCILERELSLHAELSVCVARRPSGEVQVFAASQNWHSQGVLRTSVLPGDLPTDVTQQAYACARDIAEKLQLEGVLAIEFFVTDDAQVLVNELAPRPHNTFHTTDGACTTSQFEQHVRSVCDLPLGAVDVVRPTALANLLGDLWAHDTVPDFVGALALPDVQLHLYGKAPRAGRKMGHLLAFGDSAAEALRCVQDAYDVLSRKPKI